LQPAELTNIIVAYKSRADFVPNSLIHEFERTVLKISPHLTGPQAVSLLLKMSDTDSNDLIEVFDRIIGKKLDTLTPSQVFQAYYGFKTVSVA